MAAVTIWSDFGAPSNSLSLFLLFAHLFAIKWWDQNAMILVFWMLSFKPTFSLSSFTFIKRLFSFSLLSDIRMVSSMYLRLLMFLPAILISACVSYSLAFYTMYSTYKFNEQGDNIQPWCTPVPIWNKSDVPCPVKPGLLQWSWIECVHGFKNQGVEAKGGQPYSNSQQPIMVQPCNSRLYMVKVSPKNWVLLESRNEWMKRGVNVFQRNWFCSVRKGVALLSSGLWNAGDPLGLPGSNQNRLHNVPKA